MNLSGFDSKLKRLEATAAIASRKPSDIVWTPQAAQIAAIESPADILWYGGAAGGGKTDLLLGLAIKHHHRSIIFRREYPQLRAIEERSRSIIKSMGQYNGTDKVWRLPGGRILEFGAVQLLGDEEKYQGRPHSGCFFDEISQFAEAQFRFLMGWLRSERKGERCRVVCAGNPPMDQEGEWVIRFWAPWLDKHHPNPAAPGELRWFTTLDDREVELEHGEPFVHNGERITPKSRTFIPATLEDNAYLRDTGYAGTLQAMPEPYRSKLLYGSFGASQSDDEWQVIPTAWVVAAQARWEAIEKPQGPMTAMGVDVARGGKDRTVITPRFGNWIGEQRVYPGSATPDGQSVLGLILKERQGNATVNIDVIGVGSSVYDLCKDRMPTWPINSSERSVATDKSGQIGFVNLRAQIFWLAREMLDPESGEDIALPPGRALLADLCAPRWKMRSNGIQIESKEDIIKRIGRSPDLGDSCVYALSIPRFEGWGILEFCRQDLERQELETRTYGTNTR